MSREPRSEITFGWTVLETLNCGNGPQTKRGEGWRIPAAELERLVTEQAVELLGNRSLLGEWMENMASTSDIERGFEAAAQRAQRLEESAELADRRQILQTIFESVTLTPNCIRFELRQNAIVDWLADGKIDPPSERELLPSTNEK